MQHELEETQERADIAENQVNKLRTKSREFGKVRVMLFFFCNIMLLVVTVLWSVNTHAFFLPVFLRLLNLYN